MIRIKIVDLKELEPFVVPESLIGKTGTVEGTGFKFGDNILLDEPGLTKEGKPFPRITLRSDMYELF